MTLMRLGPVEFNLRVNPQKISTESDTPFAVHEVIGSRPVREFMGEGDTTFQIEAVIFPEHFGGMEGLALLEAARLAHTPIPFMRGNLIPMGWVLIESLSIQDNELNENAVGLEITFTAKLVATATPASTMAVQILSLFQ